MKLGLGLKPEQWDEDHLAFARQMGCESIVAWVPLAAGDGVWHEEGLLHLKEQVNRHDMELAAIENLHPAHWDHVLLGEDGRDEQIDKVCQTIRNLGAVGIGCLGYSFSIVGVWGHWSKGDNADGRGGAGVLHFDADKIPAAGPPNNQRFWLEIAVPDRSPAGTIPPVDAEQMWQRLEYFLKRVVPVAQSAGVRLAAHPDDPPVPALRGTGRLLHSVENLQRLLDMAPSPYNCLEFCQGTVAEMAGVDVIAAIRRFASQGKIAYVHFRNVSATVPRFSEVFVDDGRVDMLEALRTYRDSGFDGVLIPDHTPIVSTAAPWETGMAFALGYLRAGLQTL